MGEFLGNVPLRELLNLAAQAEQGHLEASEALIRHEIHRRLTETALTATGLYDASQDVYDTPVHPDDERWVVRGEE